MGVYSNNRFSSISDIQVEAAEGYNGEIGAQLAMIEGFENDLAIFDGQIMNDFNEAGMIKEGASEADIQAVQEGAVGDFLGKIKEFFIKLWEKIKGIFRGFLAKFDSVVMKSNKAFHDKYSKEVYAKDLSKMKIKYSAPVSDKLDLEFPDIAASSTAATNKVCLDASVLASTTTLDKLIEDFDREDFICNILNESGHKPSVKITSTGDYAKDVHEALFKDEEEQDGCDTVKYAVGGILSAKKDPIEIIRKSNATIDKAFKTMISDIEKARTTVTKLLPGKDGALNDVSNVQKKFGTSADQNDKDSNGNAKYKSYSSSDTANNSFDKTPAATSKVRNINRALNYIHTQATAIQGAATMFTSVSLKETKFLVAQARRVFASAVAFNPKAVKENALYVEAVGESAEFELMSDFQNY